MFRFVNYSFCFCFSSHSSRKYTTFSLIPRSPRHLLTRHKKHTSAYSFAEACPFYCFPRFPSVIFELISTASPCHLSHTFPCQGSSPCDPASHISPSRPCLPLSFLPLPTTSIVEKPSDCISSSPCLLPNEDPMHLSRTQTPKCPPSRYS